MDQPDLSGAEIYVEASERPIAGGRWHVMPDDTVFYERRPGVFDPPTIIAAGTLRTNPAWRRAWAI